MWLFCFRYSFITDEWRVAYASERVNRLKQIYRENKFTSISESPLLGRLDRLSLVRLPLFSNVCSQRILKSDLLKGSWLLKPTSGFGADKRAWMDRRTVRIWRAGDHLSEIWKFYPNIRVIITLENVQADSAELVNVRMVDFGHKANFWRSHRVLLWQEQLQLEDATSERRVVWTSDHDVEVSGIAIVWIRWYSRHWVSEKSLSLFDDSSRQLSSHPEIRD